MVVAGRLVDDDKLSAQNLFHDRARLRTSAPSPQTWPNELGRKWNPEYLSTSRKSFKSKYSSKMNQVRSR
jgi:hypothetical protein